MGGPFDRWKIVYESRGGQPFCQKLASNLITIPFIDYIHVKWRPRRKLTRLKSGLWDEFKTNISATKPYQWECFWNSSNKRKYESIFECSTFSSITQSSEGTASRERNMIYWRIPCENLRPLAGRICEPYSWQHSLAYAATDREMYTTAKMNTHTHTHTPTQDGEWRSEEAVRIWLRWAPLRNIPPKVQNDFAMDGKLFIKIHILDSIPANSASFPALWVQLTLLLTKHVQYRIPLTRTGRFHPVTGHEGP